MAATARGAVARRSTQTALPPVALPLASPLLCHVAVPIVRRSDSAMQHAVTAPRMNDWECVPLRRVSALTPAHPRRGVLCACGCVCIVPAVHSRCLTHSLPHPSPPTRLLAVRVHGSTAHAAGGIGRSLQSPSLRPAGHHAGTRSATALPRIRVINWWCSRIQSDSPSVSFSISCANDKRGASQFGTLGV